jgi:hypothetical protein
MGKIRLSLSVSDSHLKNFGKVAQAAKKAGMKVEQQLADLGVLTGSIDETKVKELRAIDGVSHVEQEREIKLPPRTDPVQ